ncbi:dihydropteroate synthase [Dehalococcoides mccartyi]|jgi:dihydropteroate synthase|uniref:dihydropteroate synthase n=1 Tax=Dehalococcoides mccartyi TaxID=61435 RepID=UPI0009A542A7|nr:dihydropteroate synthase [Dehalococcoides mccartyi]AQY73849.1 dihydropteroate synthase [Dehalococcoides mccartyi]
MNLPITKPASSHFGSKQFGWGERTYIMGIVNVTPDSFSGDGLGANPEAALEQARRFVKEGADILDIGGESTRPNCPPVSTEEELGRVILAIRLIVRNLDIPISIDTYRREVAEEALKAGACIVNDVWSLQKDPSLFELAAKSRAGWVITSNQREHPVEDIMKAVTCELKSTALKLLELGVPAQNIIIDPGVGFGKTLEQNLEIVRRLSELKTLNLPVLLGTSRKSLIGQVLDTPPNERLEGTAATVALGIGGGVDIVRVHDVARMRRVCQMSDAVIRGKIWK